MIQIKSEPMEEKPPQEKSKFNPSKRRCAYTHEDDMELIYYFLEKYRAGDPEAMKKQGKRLWEPVIEEKQWERQSSAVESHFRKIVVQKLFDFNLPGTDVFILAVHFDVAVDSILKAQLEVKYNCRIDTNTFGHIVGAFGPNGEELHYYGCVDSVREVTKKEFRPRRRRDRDETFETTAKISRLGHSMVQQQAMGLHLPTTSEEAFNGTVNNNETENVMDETFVNLLAGLDKLAKDNMFPQIVNNNMPINQSGPLATPSGPTILDMTKAALVDRLMAVVNGKMNPEEFDQCDIFARANGCRFMINILKSILTTLFNGSSEELRHFDKKHRLMRRKRRSDPNMEKAVEVAGNEPTTSLGNIFEKQSNGNEVGWDNIIEMLESTKQEACAVENVVEMDGDDTLVINNDVEEPAEASPPAEEENPIDLLSALFKATPKKMIKPSNGTKKQNEKAKNLSFKNQELVTSTPIGHGDFFDVTREEAARRAAVEPELVEDSFCLTAPTSDSQRPDNDITFRYQPDSPSVC
ncbi:unnamed protein product [Bursaphelenchus okinawaensis]|uniref:SPK domain-containing protein n=1 Tax=Bursaphelenchus okinawaensis TaxID=465554 RepID=A0A811KC00_9BILA|nr:unnamed protein product [Bursaphelenchus okinawaensis]CAG9097857.1 unnamed protein product [Bursaphelenchus okinawaensis]